MTDCNDIKNKLIPISRVVNAAMLSTYSDVGKSKELFTHFAALGVKKLQKEVLKVGKKYVLLTVNHNTKTATLPFDFDKEIFVGYIDNHGKRVPLSINEKLINSESIEDIGIQDTCEKCGQDKNVCNDLQITESDETVYIQSAPYIKTTIKKLYPNGDYFLETSTPYFNTVTETVEYATIKKFIAALSLKECGCLQTTEDNLSTLNSCNSDVYDCYFSECSRVCDRSMGGYRIFKETGLIQLDYKFNRDKVYIEYIGFMPKVNGQYAVPEEAFLTLRNWVIFSSIENKSNVPLSERNWALQNYRRERGNMMKIKGRMSLSQIILAIHKLPNFEIDWGNECPTKCVYTANPYVSQITSSTVCESTNSCIPSGNIISYKAPFQIAVMVGSGADAPIAGEYTYQNDGLIGAIDLKEIHVDNNLESTLAGQFTFNNVSGTITRTNPWFDGSVLIAGFAKIIK